MSGLTGACLHTRLVPRRRSGSDPAQHLRTARSRPIIATPVPTPPHRRRSTEQSHRGTPRPRPGRLPLDTRGEGFSGSGAGSALHDPKGAR
jgi:hypothetical protein